VTVALGVDWSGGRAARRKIWAARIDLGEQALIRLWRPFAHCRGPEEVAAAVPPWLGEESFDVAGFDFCFGLASAQLQRLDLPLDGPAALGRALTARSWDAEEFRRAVGPERKRATDLARRTTFAPTNLRMYRQTYWGLRTLADVDAPIPPWSFGDRPVVEVFPRHVRRALGPELGLKIGADDRAAMERDRDGDALDAVLAALAAGAALSHGFAGVPSDAASSGEGWIYSLD
jgi:hypothetical protein